MARMSAKVENWYWTVFALSEVCSARKLRRCGPIRMRMASIAKIAKPDPSLYRQAAPLYAEDLQQVGWRKYGYGSRVI